MSLGQKADGTLSNVEFLEVAQLVGTALGSAVATAAAVWGALVRPLQRKLDETSEGIRAPNPEIALLKQEQTEIKRRLEKAEDRVASAVTDDEFEAYTKTTNKSVQALTEKIGAATGAIEAWYRLADRGN